MPLLIFGEWMIKRSFSSSHIQSLRGSYIPNENHQRTIKKSEWKVNIATYVEDWLMTFSCWLCADMDVKVFPGSYMFKTSAIIGQR